jgi:hypothetical protein
MAKGRTRVVELIRERKIEKLLKPPRGGNVLEASGVFARGRECFVIFDNTRRAACIGADLRPGSPSHRWLGRLRFGEGYEAITYSRRKNRFYLLIEAEKHPDGTYKGVIEEFDDRWKFKARRWVNLPFEKRNTGFEGLTTIHWRGEDYLLALCEGNKCRAGKNGHKRGGGRIHVLQLAQGMWQPVALIKLPPEADFKDYSDLALRGDRLAVVSQESSGLWVGRFRPGKWSIVGSGRTYDFPRTKKGKRLYFTGEGISWLSPNTLVAVSDLRKKSHPKRSKRTDQSIHIFKT